MFVTYTENSLIIKLPILTAKIRKRRKKSFIGSATELEYDFEVSFISGSGSNLIKRLGFY